MRFATKTRARRNLRSTDECFTGVDARRDALRFLFITSFRGHTGSLKLEMCKNTRARARVSPTIIDINLRVFFVARFKILAATIRPYMIFRAIKHANRDGLKRRDTFTRYILIFLFRNRCCEKKRKISFQNHAEEKGKEARGKGENIRTVQSAVQ